MLGSENQHTGADSSSRRAIDTSKFLLGGLCCLALLAMVPVLIHSHWGMFSDRLQIVECCQRLASADAGAWFNDSLTDLRPATHWPDYFTWFLSPNNPTGFYLVRTVWFVTAVAFTYLNCLKLSKSPLSAFVASIFWFLALPTYEVIYTLDKGETLIATLFSVVIWMDLDSRKGANNEPVNVAHIIVKLMLSATAILYALFSKQTGQLIVFYAGLALFPQIVTTMTKRPAPVDAFKSLNTWSSKLFFVASLSWIAYQLFFISEGGPNHQRYKEVNYSLGFMIEHMISYLHGMPEICVLLFGAFILILPISLGKKVPRHSDLSSLQNAIICLITSVFGALVLSAWKGNIVYGWFPLLTFLLPAFAYGLQKFGQICQPFILGLGLIFIVWFAPLRFIDAQLQLQMDSLFSSLAPACLQSITLPTNANSLILPFDVPSSFEVGNILGLALKSSANFAYNERKSSITTMRVANIMKFSFPSDAQTSPLAPPNLTRPGLEKCFMTKNGGWISEPVRVGDIVLVPSGDVSPMPADYRGIPMFYKSWQKWTGWLGQLELKPVFRISKSIKRVGMPSQTMEWVGLSVNKTPPLSIETSDGGWIFDGAKVLGDKQLVGSTVTIETRNSHRLQQLKVTNSVQNVMVTARNVGGHSFWDIPLSATEETLSAVTAHEKPLFLIQDVKISGKGPKK